MVHLGGVPVLVLFRVAEKIDRWLEIEREEGRPTAGDPLEARDRCTQVLDRWEKYSVVADPDGQGVEFWARLSQHGPGRACEVVDGRELHLEDLELGALGDHTQKVALDDLVCADHEVADVRRECEWRWLGG